MQAVTCNPLYVRTGEFKQICKKNAKRKRVVLPIESYNRLFEGRSVPCKDADEFGVRTLTVGDNKNEAGIQSFASSMENMSINKKGRKGNALG